MRDCEKSVSVFILIWRIEKKIDCVENRTCISLLPWGDNFLGP